MNNKKLIKEVASNLNLELTDNVIKEIDDEWSFFNDSLDIINSVDTKNVDKMFSPDFTPINYLREDVLEENDFDKSVVFKNTKISKNQFLVIKRVVK